MALPDNTTCSISVGRMRGHEALEPAKWLNSHSSTTERKYKMGQPAARISDTVTCVGSQDTIMKGSSTVFINTLPAARMGVMVALLFWVAQRC